MVKDYFEYAQVFEPSKCRRQDLITLREAKIVPREAQPCEYCKCFRMPVASLKYYRKSHLIPETNTGASEAKPYSCYECGDLEKPGMVCKHDDRGVYSPCLGCTCCDQCIKVAEEAQQSGKVAKSIESASAPKWLGIRDGECKHHEILVKLGKEPRYPSEYQRDRDLDGMSICICEDEE